MKFGRKFFFLGTLLVAGLARSAPLQGADDAVFIDPSDPAVIRRTVIPFASEVLLRASDLPTHSEAHPNVAFGEQRFSYISLSPDGSHLAFSVDGSLSDWSGVYDLGKKELHQVALSFDAQALAPVWAADGRRVVFEEEDSVGRRYLQVYDLAKRERCGLDYRSAKSKYLNLHRPWWSEAGDKVYFQVEVNNKYRRSMGLKPLTAPARIGEANAQCQELVVRSVEKFMAEVPDGNIPREALATLPKGPL
ncbi:MAG: PD40 domain-containing protein [Deltaproteobacteria bacterium]|nr:PD40 domain-containing protein [Deltaproteobacteria bacterium]